MQYKNYTCEIVLNNNKSVFEYKHPDYTSGQVFIEGRLGSEYSIRLKNNTNDKVLMIPSVDGLSILDGKPANQESQGYVLGPWQSTDILGWTLDNSSVAKFVFGTKESSYAKQNDVEGAEQNVGVIGVLVFKEEKPKEPEILFKYKMEPWYIPYPYPAPSYPYREKPIYGNEPWITINNSFINHNVPISTAQLSTMNTTVNSTQSILETSIESNTEFQQFTMGTEFGKAAEFKTVQTSFEKDKNTLVVLTIYYDTLAALKARGVDVSQPKKVALLPRAFSDLGCKPPANWTK
ncbi:MAG: hypothetical protein KGH75_01415 [Rhodospirillales bacterium]|nr:hypothetical protein [Rhodospirillales bacterium]